MLKSKNTTGKKNRINVRLDIGIVDKSKKILKRKYNDDNFSGLIEWQLDKFIDDETAMDILEKGLSKSEIDKQWIKFVKEKINQEKKS